MSKRKTNSRSLQRHDDEPAVACIVCGCTEDNACEGSCAWACADPPVCSRCSGQGEPFTVDAGDTVVGPGPELPMGGRAIEICCEDEEQAQEVCAALNRAFRMGGVSAVALGVSLETAVGALNGKNGRRRK